MTLNEFEHCLLLYGSDLDNWPLELRQAGEQLRRDNSEAGRLQKEIRDLDVAIKAAAFAERASFRRATTKPAAAPPRGAIDVLLSPACAALLLLTMGLGFGLGYTNARTEAIEAAVLGLAAGDLQIGEWQ